MMSSDPRFEQAVLADRLHDALAAAGLTADEDRLDREPADREIRAALVLPPDPQLTR
jgi:hypothetical protein